MSASAVNAAAPPPRSLGRTDDVNDHKLVIELFLAGAPAESIVVTRTLRRGAGTQADDAPCAILLDTHGEDAAQVLLRMREEPLEPVLRRRR